MACTIQQIIAKHKERGVDLTEAEAKAIQDGQVERQVENDTGSVTGSMDLDDQIRHKMRDGSWKKLPENSGLLKFMDNTLDERIGATIAHADENNHEAVFDEAYQQAFYGLYMGIKKAVADTGASDLTHHFEMYETDLDHSVAFWESELHDGNIDESLLNSSNEIQGGKIVVLIGKNGFNQQSQFELLHHELIHSATEIALRQNGEFMRQVAAVQREAMKQLTYNDLISHIANPTVSEIKQAKETLRYMNGDPSEFLAYAYSNPSIFKALTNMNIVVPTFNITEPDGKFGKIGNVYKEIANKVVSQVSNGPTAMTALSKQMSAVLAWNMNAKTHIYNGHFFTDLDAEHFEGKLEKTNEFLLKGSEKIADAIGKFTDKDSDARKTVESIAESVSHINGLRQLRNSGVLQSIAWTMFKRTTDQDMASSFELIRKMKGLNEKEQDSLKQAGTATIDEWFKDVPAEQRVAITDLLSADTGVLNVSKEELADLLKNPERLDREIANYKSEIRVNEYINQARDLGWYMQHMEVKNPYLQNNAYRIYHRKYGTDPLRPLGDHLDADTMIHRIDELATLYALKFIDQKNKDHIVKLIESDISVASKDITHDEKQHPVDLALNLYATTKSKERESFNIWKNNFDKGYMRKSFNHQMKTIIVPESLKSEMDKKGYGKSYEATYSPEATKMRNDGEKYYLMHGYDYSASRTQGAIYNVGFFDKLQNTADIYDGSEYRYETHANRVAEYQRAYLSNPELDIGRNSGSDSVEAMMSRENHLMPVIDINGKTKDYAVVISRSDSENKLSLDRDVASSLGATFVHQEGKAKAVINNMQVVNHLLEQELDNKDNPDYVLLRRTTEREKSKGIKYRYEDAYNSIADYTREYIKYKKQQVGMSDPEGIWVHKSMVDDYVGYKDASIANLKINGLFDMANHPVLQLNAQKVEYWIKKAMARYKTAIVILNPKVIAGNAISNMNIAWIHGVHPNDYFKLFVKKWRELDDYNRLHNELMMFETEQKAGVKGLEHKIRGLKKQIEANGMHELMEDGQFNLIIEDLNDPTNKEDHVERIKREGVEKVFGKDGNKSAQGILENMSLTKNSKFFKGLEKLTTYNDIINRAIIQDRMKFDLELKIRSGEVKKEERAAKEREILNYLDQLFVNYSYLDNKYIKYANDMGLILFTKYLFRALKTMEQTYKTNPAGTAAYIGSWSTLSHTDVVKHFIDNPYKNYADPIGALENRVGPIPQLDFGQLIKEILMPEANFF